MPRKCPPNGEFYWREPLKTYGAGESVSSRVCQIRRRTLGTCPLLTANFTRSRRFLEAPSRGFTLVEILIVVVIIGIALSLTTSNLFISDEQRVKLDAERLMRLVERTRDQAVFSGYPIAMRLTDAGIEFLERDPNSVEPIWRTASAEKLPIRGWRDGIRAEITAPERLAEGNRSMANTGTGTNTSAEQGDKIVTFLPTGVGAPFSLRVYSAQYSRTIDGDALGNVSLRR
jgi:type II secretion system protein H